MLVFDWPLQVTNKEEERQGSRCWDLRLGLLVLLLGMHQTQQRELSGLGPLCASGITISIDFKSAAIYLLTTSANPDACGSPSHRNQFSR